MRRRGGFYEATDNTRAFSMPKIGGDDMRRIRGFYVSDEERVLLERYLTVIRECTPGKVQAVSFTVDAYFNNLKDNLPGYKKKKG